VLLRHAPPPLLPVGAGEEDGSGKKMLIQILVC